MHVYDYVIIGGGLTGLTIAKKISEETENILVLEAQDYIGGSNHVARLQQHEINNGLRFFPGSEQSVRAISFLEYLLKQKINLSIVENNPETYESSGFKRFVGFGDKTIEFYDQLNYFLSDSEMQLGSQPYQWIQSLKEALHQKIMTKSIVTRFGFESLDSESPKLTHILVNGTKTIHAQHFIFTGSVKDLRLLLPDDVLNPRAKAKLKKSQAWQGVCVDLFHSHKIDKPNLFFLNGTTDDDIGPCVGRFLTENITLNQTPSSVDVEGQVSGQVSQWLSFVDSESAEDTENIGLVLKKIKRQIKRAFPEIAESIKAERIFISPPLSGADVKINANGSFPKVPNLWIGSAQLSIKPNLLGALLQAQTILAALGFMTASPADLNKGSEEAELEPSTEQEL
jgi:hypothetical protein